MTSTRTEYRVKRIELIGQMIIKLAHILTLEKRQIEKIKLPLLKKIYLETDVVFAQAHNLHRIKIPTLNEANEILPPNKFHTAGKN
jgi:hypothetical protein